MIDRDGLMAGIVDLAAAAGVIVWRHFRAGTEVEIKSDESPVTIADREAESLILEGLARLAASIPVVAEEEMAAGRCPVIKERFFLVDPLDGTKEFIRRGTDFTVNIGLIERGSPTLGVVYAPARSALWWGDVAAGAAWTAEQAPGRARGAARPIRVAARAGAPRAVASRSHPVPATDAWLAAAGISEFVSIGSSLKFVLVAGGEADVYPRPSPTMEWDTAAGDAVLRAAGGRVFDLDGAALAYGKPDFRNEGFVAAGSYDPAPLRPFVTA